MKKSYSIIILVSILGLASWLRYTGLNFGLPNPYIRPDEMSLIYPAVNLRISDLNPHFFDYPSFYIYLIAFVIRVYFSFWRGLAFAWNTEALSQLFATNITPFFILGRITTASLGIVSVALIYILGKKMYSERCGLWAAAFLAINFLNVRDSQFATTDIALNTMILFSFLFIQQLKEKGRWKNYLLVGITIGLAISVKYSALFLVLIFLGVHFLKIEPRNNSKLISRQRWRKFITDKKLWVALSLSVVTFLAVTPFAIIDFKSFLRDFLSEMIHFKRGHYGFDFGWGAWYHLKFTLPQVLGTPFFLFACGSVVFLLLRRKSEDILLLALIFIYYAVIGNGKVVFIRYTVPLISFLCLAAAVMLASLTEIFWSEKKVISVIIGSVAIIMFILLPMKRIIAYKNVLSSLDTRILTSQWIKKNIPEGSKIAIFGGWESEPQLPETKESLEMRIKDYYRTYGKFSGERVSRYPSLQLKYLKDNSSGYIVRHIQRTATNLERVIQDRFSYLIYTEHCLSFAGGTEEVKKRLLRDWKLVYSCLAYSRKEECLKFKFDKLDAFFMPLNNFQKVNRAGPNIFIFKFKGENYE